MNAFSRARSWAMASERVARPQLVAQHLERLDRQILELVGDDIDLVCAKRCERDDVVDTRRE